MRPDSSRWREVTPSEFTHESEGLAHVREVLPDRKPYRAWSNFEFRDSSGKWHEVDLLVLGERRLHLVELKHYRGVITGSAYHWRHGGRTEETPLRLAKRKAQRLRSVITEALKELAPDLSGDAVPYIQECVFLHARDGRCDLPQGDRNDLFGLDGIEQCNGLPGIGSRLLEPAYQPPPALVTQDDLQALLFDHIGFTVRREPEIGSWRLTGPAEAEGDGWQDWPAEHGLRHQDTARVRFFVSRPGASKAQQEATRQLVQREYELTKPLQHEGLLTPQDIVEGDLGVGLVYEKRRDWRPLDLWLPDHFAELSIDQKVGVIRQLTEVVGYAHRNHVVHRGLTPRAVTVEEKVGELRVRLGDWQVAGMEDPTAGSRPTGGAATRVLRLLGHGVAPDVAQQQAEAYVAPEGRFDPDADRVRLDVFALGAVAYYVVAGRPPASTPNELRDRVQRENGLDLAADVPEAPDALRRLVLHATRPKVSDRLADVAAFLEQLSTVDGELTVPGENAPADPLDAAPGTRLGERFELVRRMGSGSTAVGLLVTDRDAGGERRVLKVALDDAAARRLGHEAEVLRALRGTKSGRLVRLVDDDVLTVGERSALLLESAGEQTLADVLHERERLSLDLLDRWGTDLLEALVALDKAGIDHRDVKPANLGVREQRNDRAKHLVLFDFSLARTPAGSVDIGTPRYRDPFLGSGTRQQWDSAAERFAAAATLHEMATGRVPVFGDGRTDPAVITDEATVDPAWFDPSIASEMVAFFRQALCRDARSRQHTAAEMLSQWRGIFGTPTTTVPEDADALVDAATPDTPLAESGLSARALSAVEPFDVATVGDLIRVDPGRLSRLTGVADPTRKEVRGRAKTWRERFPDAARRSAGAGAAGDSGPLADPAATATALVDACGTPRATARRRAAEVLLGLAGDVDGFATHADFAPALDVATSAAVSLSFGKLQDAWASNDEARATLDGVTRLAFDVLAGLGGIAWSDVLVAELAGTSADGEPDQRRIRLVQGLVRAALDRADATERGGGDEAAMTRRRRRDGRVLLASAPMLLDITDPLVERVERLVTEATRVGDPIVPASRAAGALRPLWPSDEQAIDDVGLARLAARLSGPVGASRQGELHDRDLAPGIAVRSAVGGLASSQAIAPEDLQARVRARFPDLVALPNRPRLDQVVADSGLDLRWDGERYVAPSRGRDASMLTSRSEIPVHRAHARGTSREDRQLASSIDERGFLALGVPSRKYDDCASELVARHGAVRVDVTAVLIDALRAQAQEAGIGWEYVRAADAAEPGSRDAQGLAALVKRAVPSVEQAVTDAGTGAPAGTRPVLLLEAGSLARYGHTGLLARLADITVARNQAVWLLVPVDGDAALTLDGAAVPLAHGGQFVRLDTDWLHGNVREGEPA